MPEVDGYVWHGFIPACSPGSATGSASTGPTSPSSGLRCNPDKLLLDPYAKAIDGEMSGDPSLFGYNFDDPRPGLDPDPNTLDSLGHTLTSVVINPFFDWGQDRAPGHDYHESIIYEAHVKGLTKRLPALPKEIRGTYAGIATPRRSRT